MSLEWLLLGLRLVATLILYSFLGVAFYLIWRELKQAEYQTNGDQSTARLRVVSTGDQSHLVIGQSFPLHPVTFLGHDAAHQFTVGDAAPRHPAAHLHYQENRWWLDVASSTNGLKLNLAPLSGPTPVTHGDLIEVDNVCFRLETKMGA